MAACLRLLPVLVSSLAIIAALLLAGGRAQAADGDKERTRAAARDRQAFVRECRSLAKQGKFAQIRARIDAVRTRWHTFDPHWDSRCVADICMALVSYDYANPRVARATAQALAVREIDASPELPLHLHLSLACVVKRRLAGDGTLLSGPEHARVRSAHIRLYASALDRALAARSALPEPVARLEVPDPPPGHNRFVTPEKIKDPRLRAAYAAKWYRYLDDLKTQRRREYVLGVVAAHEPRLRRLTLAAARESPSLKRVELERLLADVRDRTVVKALIQAYVDAQGNAKKEASKETAPSGTAK